MCRNGVKKTLKGRLNAPATGYVFAHIGSQVSGFPNCAPCRSPGAGGFGARNFVACQHRCSGSRPAVVAESTEGKPSVLRLKQSAKLQPLRQRKAADLPLYCGYPPADSYLDWCFQSDKAAALHPPHPQPVNRSSSWHHFSQKLVKPRCISFSLSPSTQRQG